MTTNPQDEGRLFALSSVPEVESSLLRAQQLQDATELLTLEQASASMKGLPGFFDSNVP